MYDRRCLLVLAIVFVFCCLCRIFLCTQVVGYVQLANESLALCFNDTCAETARCDNVLHWRHA